MSSLFGTLTSFGAPASSAQTDVFSPRADPISGAPTATGPANASAASGGTRSMLRCRIRGVLIGLVGVKTLRMWTDAVLQ